MRPNRDSRGLRKSMLLWMRYPCFSATVNDVSVRVRRFHALTQREIGSVDIPLSQWVAMTPHERNELAMSYLRNAEEQAEAQEELRVGMDPDFSTRCPAIFDYVTLVRDEQNKTRQTSTLTLSVDQGAFKALLNDRQTGFQVFVTADTLWGAIDALEAVLKSPRVPWRRNPWHKDAPKRK